MHKPSDYLKKDGNSDTSLDEFFNRNKEQIKTMTDEDLGQIVGSQRAGYAQWQKDDADKADKKKTPRKKKTPK